jgi:hypothetical protein
MLARIRVRQREFAERRGAELLPELRAEECMKQCEWVTYTPIFATHIAGVKIDPSEYATSEGAHLFSHEARCRYVADPDKKYCPRHEMEAALLSKPPAPSACSDCIVPRPTAEADDALGVPREWRERHNDGGNA